MDILWYDGLENYVAPGNVQDIGIMAEGLWIQAEGAGIYGIGNARLDAAPATGNGCLLDIEGGQALRRYLGADYTYVGATLRFWLGAIPSTVNQGYAFCQFRDSNNNAHMSITISPVGQIQIIVGGLDRENLEENPNIVATSTLVVSAASWNHIEVKAKIAASGGYVKVRVNGQDFVDYTGAVISGEDNAIASAAQFSMGLFNPFLNSIGADVETDDFVAISWASDGSEDTDFLGQYGVYYLPPNADTVNADWLKSTGSDGFALIDEIQPDDDATFIYATSSTAKSAFDVQPLPTNIVAVAAVMPIVRVRKTDTGVCTVGLGVISSGTEDDASANSVVQSYDYYWSVWQTDPHTSSAWNPLNMPEIVVERTS